MAFVGLQQCFARRKGQVPEHMRASIAILTATLALTVFLTSLLLETRDSKGHRANLRSESVDAVPASSRILLGQYEPTCRILKESAPGEAAASKTVKLLNEAQRFMTVGNLEGAAELLQAALKIDPEHPVALEAMGVACFARRQYAEAEEFLTRFIELDNEATPICRMRLGVAQMRQGKYEAALENLRIVHSHEPTDGAVQFALACVYSRLENEEKALHHLELAYAQFGYDLLAHISSPHLDNLRNTKKFQKILHSALLQYRQTTIASSPDAGTGQ